MIDHVNDIINIEIMTYVLGITAICWLVILKYNIHYEFLGFFKKLAGFLGLEKVKNASIQICVMCVTFWISFVLFFVLDDTEMPARVSKAFIRGLILTPFIIKLIKDQFDGSD